DLDPLVERQINASNTCHISSSIPLTLSLLVLGDGADDPHDPLAVHNLALRANSFNGCSHFHKSLALLAFRSQFSAFRSETVSKLTTEEGQLNLTCTCR